MTRDEAKHTKNKITEGIRGAVNRLVELEKEGVLGLPHTALREQLYVLLELADYYSENDVFPFAPTDWNEVKTIKAECKTKFGWFGYI